MSPPLLQLPGSSPILVSPQPVRAYPPAHTREHDSEHKQLSSDGADITLDIALLLLGQCQEQKPHPAPGRHGPPQEPALHPPRSLASTPFDPISRYDYPYPSPSSSTESSPSLTPHSYDDAFPVSSSHSASTSSSSFSSLGVVSFPPTKLSTSKLKRRSTYGPLLDPPVPPRLARRRDDTVQERKTTFGPDSLSSKPDRNGAFFRGRAADSKAQPPK